MALQKKDRVMLESFLRLAMKTTIGITFGLCICEAIVKLSTN